MKLRNIEYLKSDMISDCYNTIVVDRCKLKNHVCHDIDWIASHHSSRLNDFLIKNTLGRVFEEHEMKNKHSLWYVPASQEDINIKVENFRTLLYDSDIIILEKQENNELYNVSKKYPLIFVHTPKTAGTSLNNMLDIGETVGGHKTLKQLKSLLNKSIYDSYKKVSVIRNPYDRIVSLYKATEPQFIEMAKEKGFEEENYSFESWFWDIVSHLNNITTEPLFYSSCYDLMIDDSDELAIDYIIRYENLGEDLKKMFDDMGVDTPIIPKLNVASIKHPDLYESNSKMHYSKYYECSTKEVMIEFIYEIFKKDFDTFGYEFEEKKNGENR